MVKPIPSSLAQRIGAELRRHRDAAGRRQDEIAAVARDFGFRTWTRGTVAMIESGRRRLSLEEFFAVPMMLAPLGIHVTLTSLLGGEGMLALSPSTTVSVETLDAMLAGRFDSATLASALTDERALLTTDEVEDARRVWRRMSGSRRPPDASRLRSLVLASQGSAEVWAAHVLHTTPLVVAMLAAHTWGRSLTAERDARVEHRPGGAATIQAHRGHVTRELIAELHAALRSSKGTVASRHRSRKGKRG